MYMIVSYNSTPFLFILRIKPLRKYIATEAERRLRVTQFVVTMFSKHTFKDGLRNNAYIQLQQIIVHLISRR